MRQRFRSERPTDAVAGHRRSETFSATDQGALAATPADAYAISVVSGAISATRARPAIADEMDYRLQLIESEIPRLRRYARYLTKDVEQADDLVQECLTRAIAKLDTWQPGSNLRAWLFVILRNVHISEARRRSRSPGVAPVDGDHPGLAVVGSQESRLMAVELARAVATLSEEQREVLHLVAVEGLKYDEAATLLEIPVGTVRSRLSRARTTLRLLLEGHIAPDAHLTDEGQSTA